MAYYLGADVVLKTNFYDATGALTNPGTVTCTVTDPTGAVTTPAPTSTATGVYSVLVPACGTAGLWLVRWLSSGSTNTPFEDEFVIRPLQSPELINLTDLKIQLKIVNDTTVDDQLTGYIEAATEQIRDIIGPIFVETHTQYFSGGTATLGLDWLPLQSIVSITEFYGLSAFAVTEQPLGSQINAFGFTADYQTGQLTRRTFGGAPALWPIGAKNVKVTYVSGLAAIPFSVRLAGLELIQHWWDHMSRQRAGGRGRGAELDGSPSIAFGVPWSVEEKLAPWRRPPGIA